MEEGIVQIVHDHSDGICASFHKSASRGIRHVAQFVRDVHHSFMQFWPNRTAVGQYTGNRGK